MNRRRTAAVAVLLPRIALRSLLALAGVLAVAIVAAVPATASLKIHQSRRSKPTSAAFDGVTATCPRGEGAISGGYEVPQASAITGIFEPWGSFLGDDDGWQASVAQLGDELKDGFVTSFAYCAKLGKDVTTRGESTDISNGAFSDLTASCKRKETLISGGWAVSARLGTSALVFQSLKQGARSWTVSGRTTTTGTASLIALADCVPSKKAPDLVTRKHQETVNGTDSTVVASCRKSEQVVSGGFTSNTAFIPFIFHRGTRRTWGARGATLGSAGTGTTFAYCEKLAKPR